jgi:predicted ATPase/DNA-binding SARP family transcriptional activator
LTSVIVSAIHCWTTDEAIVLAGPCRLLAVRLQDGSKVCKRAARGVRETAGVSTPAELRVLGGLELHRCAEMVPIGGPKAQLLLSILVAQCDARLSVDRLVEALWADVVPKSATATIQSSVSRLRSILAPDFSITHDSGGYRFETGIGELDARRFERLLVRSRTVEPVACAEALDEALGLWHGPAFGEFADRPEVRGEAIRLDELRLAATDEWADVKMRTDHPATMVGELESLVSVHPLRECYWRLLMLALYRTGRQAEALRRANEFRTMLAHEAGLDPSPAVRELEAQIFADDPALLARDIPPPDSRVRVAAPALLGATSFIGRDPDVAVLIAALEEQPLITITGPGGVGKTRLALRVAGRVIDDFADGVSVVDFSSLRDPAGTAQLIAQALDVQQRQHRSIEATIAEFLAPSRSLLVLDSCEHVTDVLAPLVDRLRSSCPGLRILATSRQSLGLAGEFIELLAPLAVPPEGSDLTAEIGRSAAVELFVSRAAATTPGFVLTDANSVAVAEVCRRLDGIPLALELAAARLRTIGIDALSSGLHQRIEMLGQTQRGADGRLRTIHDLVKWSYDLLAPDEQIIFEQLAVFAGGFDLAAAESVCGVAETQMSVVGHVASLVDKSMIVLVDPSTSRYRVLEPLREFGLDHLRSRGLLAATEDRHLRWFVDLAERGAIGLDSPEEAVWSAALDRDFANFRAAHLTALQRQDALSALRLVSSLREFAIRSVNYEITSWADASTALEHAPDMADFPTALAVSAYGRFVRGDMQTAVDLAHRALDVSGGSELSATALPERVLGNALFYMEQTEEALRWMDRMQLSARHAASPGGIAHALYMQSVGQTSVGDEIRGAVLAGEARAAADAAGSPTARAQADYALGLALENTDPIEALQLLQRAARVGAEAGNRWIEAFALTEVHSLRAHQGDHLLALAGYAEVVDTWYRGGDWANQWLSIRRVLGILVELGVLEPAAVLHGALAAVGAAEAMPIAPAEAERLSGSVAEVRSLLGPAIFADAVRMGASLRDSEIVTFVKQQIAELTDGTLS